MLSGNLGERRRDTNEINVSHCCTGLDLNSGLSLSFIPLYSIFPLMGKLLFFLQRQGVSSTPSTKYLTIERENQNNLE